MEGQTETIRVGLLPKAMKDVHLLAIFLPSVQDVATKVVISCDAKETEKPDPVLTQRPVGLWMEHILNYE